MKKILLLLCVLLYGMASYAQQENVSVSPNEDATEIFTVVDVDASFPGGREAFYAYLYDSIMEAKAKGITGRVYVKFVIERDGSVSNVKLMRDIGGGCGEEAVRVVQSMPKWNPGAAWDGTPWRSPIICSLSIFNALAEDEEAKPFEKE